MINRFLDRWAEQREAERRGLGHDTRKLTVRPLVLTGPVQPRAHAGRKSRRIHARTWESA